MSDAAQYAIDIAARMTGGEYTAAQLDELTATLNGAGKGAAHFQEAISRVNGEWAQAIAANTNAQKALSDETAEYGRLERAAVQASKAAEKAALKNAGVVPNDLKAKAEAAAAALNSQVVVLKKLEADAGAAAKKEEDLGRQLKNIKVLSGHVDKSLAGQSEALSKVQGALSATGSPAGMLAGRVIGLRKGFSELSVVMGKSRAAALLTGVALAAIAAGSVLVSYSIARGIASLASQAVAFADSRRAALLVRDAYAAIEPPVASLKNQMVALTRNTGLNEEALGSLVNALQAAKVGAKDMPQALDAAVIAELALGQGGAKQFIDEIAKGSLTVKQFAAGVKRDLGGIARKQVMGLANQTGRLHALFGDVFGSLNIEPALSGVQRLVNLFDTSTASGSALQTLFAGIFQPLISNADNASVAIEAFVLGVEIGLVKLYIAAKPAIKALAELFNVDTSDMSGWTSAGESFVVVLEVLAVAVGGLVVLGITLTAVLALVVVAIGAAVAAVVGLGFAIGYGLAWAWEAFTGALKYVGEAIGNFVYVAVQWFVSLGEKISAWFASFSLVDMGRNMIMGLVNGITGSAGAVVNAISGAVSGAINKAKSLLGIHSPSKVFADIGDNTGAGFVEGVVGQQQAANDTMTDLVAAPQDSLSAYDSLSGNFGSAQAAPAQAAPAQAAPAQASAGGSLNLQGATFNFYGVEGAEDAEARFGEMLTKFVEGDATAIGGATKAA